jgi:hypothetical protein
LLPCDDPEWSNFTKYFAQNFERFGLKKLISTSFAANSKTYQTDYQPTLFEMEDPQYDSEKSFKNGKIFTLTRDINSSGKIVQSAYQRIFIKHKNPPIMGGSY